MSSSKLNRQSTTRTARSPIADATRPVDQKRSARGSVLMGLTLSALGFPGHAYEEGSRESVVLHRHRRRTRHVRRGHAEIHRTSVGGQGDVDGCIAIDTFIRDSKASPLDSYHLRVTLYRSSGTATPSVRMVGAMTSAGTVYEIPSSFGGTRVDNDVPTYSQEVHRGEFPEYDNGGEAWCSPTSTAMVLAYWGVGPSAADLAGLPGSKDPPYVDPQVDYAARYVYDWHYQGAGNWPDNAAYAARFGLNAFVTRLRSLREAELFINAGIPLVASIQGHLSGFFFKKTSGHLLVIRGFTATGDVIANDPAVPTDGDVTKVYGRADFENVWLGGSAGIVYVIYPRSRKLPANVPGLPANW